MVGTDFMHESVMDASYFRIFTHQTEENTCGRERNRFQTRCKQKHRKHSFHAMFLISKRPSVILDFITTIDIYTLALKRGQLECKSKGTTVWHTEYGAHPTLQDRLLRIFLFIWQFCWIFEHVLSQSMINLTIRFDFFLPNFLTVISKTRGRINFYGPCMYVLVLFLLFWRKKNLKKRHQFVWFWFVLSWFTLILHPAIFSWFSLPI